MFSMWDIVRPRMWHPMSMLEQSMMDMDMMASHMLGSRYPMSVSMLTAPNSTDDDEFFKDLPVEARGKRAATEQPESKREGTRAFSSYSFSNSSIVDDKGRRVVSTRRRYEDSTGRLKAEHDREVDGRRLKTIWNKTAKDDKGKHETICSDGSVDEFDKLWNETPFGKAQVERTKELKAQAEKEMLEAQGQQEQQGKSEHQQKITGQQQEQSQPVQP